MRTVCRDGNPAVIRPIRETDLGHLERHLGFEDPGRHRERLSLQAQELALCLIAWHGPQPVGHLLLKWPLPGTGTDLGGPEVEDLRVLPAYQTRGVGTALLLAAERAALASGHLRIGLYVHPRNGRALSLYHRLGYRMTQPASPEERGLVLGPEGRAIPWLEPALSLVKRLSGSQANPTEPVRPADS